MNGQETTHKVVSNQNELAVETVQRRHNTNELATSAELCRRQFVVPEFKVSVVKRNRSFELGYN